MVLIHFELFCNLTLEKSFELIYGFNINVDSIKLLLLFHRESCIKLML